VAGLLRGVDTLAVSVLEREVLGPSREGLGGVVCLS